MVMYLLRNNGNIIEPKIFLADIYCKEEIINRPILVNKCINFWGQENSTAGRVLALCAAYLRMTP